MSLIQKIISIILLFFSASCVSNKAVDDVWEAYLVGMPEGVMTKYSGINMATYILKQTHEPIFHKNHSNNQYNSKILSKWSRNYRETNYVLCLKDNLRYMTDKKYTPEMFFQHVELKSMRFKIDYKPKHVDYNKVLHQ